MSRAGEALLALLRPFPRLAGALHHLRNPRRFAAKVADIARRARAARAYRTAIARGRFVIEVGPPAPATRFTVLMPVYRVAEEHLRAAIASVSAQSHANFELLLGDDASPDPHVARVLAAAARDDARVRTVRRPSTGGIAVASDELLREAGGEWVAFLDHDDLLHPRALELAARALAARPETDWLFTDEDKVGEDGRHSEPCLKPGWSHHLLLTFNYVCHLRVVRAEMLRRVGGHRAGFDGAQDYDLALRVLAAGGRFTHLPGILYHWRTVPGSMARAAAAKPAAHARALRALVDHAASFPRGGAISADVLLEPASFFRVRRAPDPALAVTALAPPGAPPPPWAAETLAATRFPPSAEEVVGLARGAAGDVLAVLPPQFAGRAALDEMLALLGVPGTALVAARHCSGRRVACSGWLADARGVAWDPWAGLGAEDPGYLNLAQVPGPRLAPPPLGWLAWRRDLVDAWDAAADEPGPWRLPLGLVRLGREVVTTPTVNLQVRQPAAAPPPPPGLPGCRVDWLEEAGAVRRRGTMTTTGEVTP